VEAVTLKLHPAEVEALWWICGNWDGGYEEIYDFFCSCERRDLADAAWDVLHRIDSLLAEIVRRSGGKDVRFTKTRREKVRIAEKAS